jgi:hypothetical protein
MVLFCAQMKASNSATRLLASSSSCSGIRPAKAGQMMQPEQDGLDRLYGNPARFMHDPTAAAVQRRWTYVRRSPQQEIGLLSAALAQI